MLRYFYYVLLRYLYYICGGGGKYLMPLTSSHELKRNFSLSNNSFYPLCLWKPLKLIERKEKHPRNYVEVKMSKLTVLAKILSWWFPLKSFSDNIKSFCWSLRDNPVSWKEIWCRAFEQNSLSYEILKLKQSICTLRGLILN